MYEVYISVLDITLEVSEEGRFSLPSDREYTAAELKKIAIEVNRASRKVGLDE